MAAEGALSASEGFPEGGALTGPQSPENAALPLTSLPVTVLTLSLPSLTSALAAQMTKRTAPMQCGGFSVQMWELNAKNKNILHLPGTGSQNKSRLREKQKS